jgi:tetratricopeptide (TPR) repeat protein
MARRPTHGEIEEKTAALIALTDAFCEKSLNQEYKKLCQKAVKRLAREDPPPFLRGRLEIWAAGIVHALGGINFLFDPSFRPYLNATEVADGFGVVYSSQAQKAAKVRALLGLHTMSTEWQTKRIKDWSQGLLDQIAPFTEIDGLFAEDLFASRQSVTLNKDEFIDADRAAMHSFYDLTAQIHAENDLFRIAPALVALIKKDPDFYDTYLTLANVCEARNDESGARTLWVTAAERALQRITLPDGSWPKEIAWGWLENRHVVRAILKRALLHWDDGETEAALGLLRKLLRANPGDNIGARNYILGIRLGQRSLEEHEAPFTNGYGLDATKLWKWFDDNAKRFPDEFAWWFAWTEQDSEKT